MKITKRDLKKIIRDSFLAEGFLSSGPSREYKDASGYLFKVYNNGDVYLVGRNESRYDEPQIISDNQKIKVARNLIKDEEAAGREVGKNSILRKIERGDFKIQQNSSTQSSSNTEASYSRETGHVWLCNFPNSRPLSEAAKKSLLSRVGEENAKRALRVLNLIFPQGHGGVILMKSSGSSVYYDLGRYEARCGRGSEIELNFIDNIVSYTTSPLGEAFSVPGEVRRKSLSPGRNKSSIERAARVGGSSPEVYYAGQANDENVDAAIDFANDLYSKRCVQYSLIPSTALGKAYNCSSFAITVAAIAKTGSPGGLASRIVQYTQFAEPSRSIPPAARKLRLV